MDPTTSSIYLARDEFVDIRNRQDQQLNHEFRSIRDELKVEFASIKQQFIAINQQFIAIDKRFIAIDKRFIALEAETKRNTAYFRNNTLKNPTFRIHPVVVYDPDLGILEPEPRNFPRHAKEFYALRNPTTDNHRRMLVYLARFYDIPLNEKAELSSSDESSDDEVILLDPDHAVELLENILGLDEENFIRFREKAQNAAKHAPTQPIKRSQIQEDDPETRPRRRRLEIRPVSTNPEHVLGDPLADNLPDHKSSSSKSFSKDVIGWRTKTRSTPASERQTLHGLDAQVQKAKEAARQERAWQEEDGREDDQKSSPASPLPPSTVPVSTPSFRGFENRPGRRES